MRRTVATLLITALLSASGPLMMRDRDQDRGRDRGFNPTKIIKNIIRHLLPLDDGGITPPKP